MSIHVASPHRQRLIEDMTARQLGAASQRSHISSYKRFAAFLKRSPDTATIEDIRRFQLHLAETGTSIPNRNRLMTGLRFLFRVTLRRLDLAAEIYHLREPQKIPQVISPDEARRLLAVADSLRTRLLLSLCLRLWLTCQRSGPAQGQAHRQRTEHHSHRASQGPQGSQCHALTRVARSVAALVERAAVASRCGNAAPGTLAVPWQKGGPADDHAAAHSAVP